jgi:uncharacterized protein (TIGR00251 family)
MQRKKPDSEPDSFVLTFHVVPRSSRLAIALLKPGEYKVNLTAPPVNGAANEQLIQFLAKTLKRPSRAMEIVSGHVSRTKRIRFFGLSEKEALEILKV